MYHHYSLFPFSSLHNHTTFVFKTDAHTAVITHNSTVVITKPQNTWLHCVSITPHYFWPQFSSAIILTSKDWFTKLVMFFELIGCKLNSKHTEGNRWAINGLRHGAIRWKGGSDLLNRVKVTRFLTAVSDSAPFFLVRIRRATAQHCPLWFSDKDVKCGSWVILWLIQYELMCCCLSLQEPVVAYNQYGRS